MLSNPDLYIDPKIPISPLTISSALNFKPRICAHTMLWFGGSHLNVGYKSADPATVAGQIAAQRARGCDFAMLDWYGTIASPMASAAQTWKAQCEAQQYPFAICMDRGMFQPWNMPKGMDVNTWASQMMAYAHDNFLTSKMYEKTEDGRALMLNFDWPGVPGLDVAKVLAPYKDVAMLFEHSSGVSRPGSAGAFGWVGVSATDTQTAIENYTADFLAATAKASAANPNLIIVGGLCKGFDDHNRRPGGDPTKSCWDSTKPARFADEKQGQTFLNILDLYNRSPFKPKYLQIVTWNDFEEDTAQERGMGYATADLSVQKGVLTIELGGNLNTVDHVEIFVNGQKVSECPPQPTITFDLATLNPANNQQFTLQAVAVGRPGFQNIASGTAATTAQLEMTATAALDPALVQLPVNTVVTLTIATQTVWS